jgi:ribosome-associated protein
MSDGQPMKTDLEPGELANLIAGYALDKKAANVTILDLREVAGYTDFFVVASGNTDRQARAIYDGVSEGLRKEHGLLPRRVEGVQEGKWILMDYLDVVLHAFTPDTREHYRLEQLWGDVPKRVMKAGADGNVTTEIATGNVDVASEDEAETVSEA